MKVLRDAGFDELEVENDICGGGGQQVPCGCGEVLIDGAKSMFTYLNFERCLRPKVRMIFTLKPSQDL